MRSPNVQEFCQGLWDLRECAAACLPCGATISRLLALAVADDVRLHPGYDPEEDRRVAWCRAMAAARRLSPQARPAARGDLEFTAGYLLDRQRVVQDARFKNQEEEEESSSALGSGLLVLNSNLSTCP